MKLYQKYKTLFEKYKVNTPLRIAHFMAQCEHESGLKPINENLNYSAKRLLEVFPKYFISKEDANKYANKPEKIGNRVYANRNGNGSESSGEGFKYRGRGLIQLTGKNNYSALSKSTGIDYLNIPDLLLNEADAVISALWFWNTNNINKYADADDLDAVSDLINIGRLTQKEGDSNGYVHRRYLLMQYKKELGL